MNASSLSSPAIGSSTHSPYPSQATPNAPSEYHHAAAAAATANAALSQHQQHGPPGQQHLQDRPSQQHVPPTPTNAGKKRRATGIPGSRGVANLTPEQLAKKRANDREAQRNIRIRTKNTIESLELRIKELESQQPFQELQRALAERDRALEECEDLKRRLAQVAGIVGGQQGSGGPPGLNELADLTAQQSPLPSALHTSTQSPSHQPYPSYEPQQQHIHPDLRSPQLSGHGQTDSPGQSSYHSVEGAIRRPWSPPAKVEYASHDGMRRDRSRSQQGNSDHAAGQNGERLGLDFLLDGTPRQQTHSPRPPPHQTHRPAGSAGSADRLVPAYARLPRTCADSCPLDTLLNDFRTQRSQMLSRASTAHSRYESIGPAEPAYYAFLYPPSADDGSSSLSFPIPGFPSLPRQRPQMHALSELLVTILEKFPDVARLPEKVAVLYVMFLLLRWNICPCRPCFERLPEWCRPTREQLELEHPLWIDYLPWPHMRSQLAIHNSTRRDEHSAYVRNTDSSLPSSLAAAARGLGARTTPATGLGGAPSPSQHESYVAFDDFFIPYTTTLSLNWKFGDETVLASREGNVRADDGVDREAPVTITKAFEAHVRDLNNWSIGARFRSTFPSLVDETMRIQG